MSGPLLPAGSVIGKASPAQGALAVPVGRGTSPPNSGIRAARNAEARAGRTPMTVHTGRHFLQIPGPSNVPDRVLRAMDMPTIDHRGPEFAELGFAALAAMQRVFRTKQP